MADIKDMASLLEIAKGLSSKIFGEKQDSLYVDCLTNTGQYDTTIIVDNAFSRAYKTKRLRLKIGKEEAYRVHVYSLKPFPRLIPEAVLEWPDSFEVDLSKAADFEVIRIEVMYRLRDDCLEGMVKSRSSPEPLQDRTRFHLQAQLTDPQSLVMGFNEVDIMEFPVSAFVYVQENLDTAYPMMTTIRRLAELDRKILCERDPHAGLKIIGLQRDRHALYNRIKREAPDHILKEVMTLLNPSRFVKYLSAQDDFHLFKCEWTGADTLLNYLGFSLPRGISAISRTDLSYDRPVSRGQLMYESGRFQKDIENAIAVGKTPRQLRARERAEQKKAKDSQE